MSRFPFAALLVAIAFTCVRVFAAAWPEPRSDLPWDPAWKRGTLPNGVTYAVRRNAEPKERISLRLLVSVGSLYERPEERGISHFLEHLVFRGTERFPGDALTKELQRRGMGMGPDHTAFTGYDYTIYHLELPDPSEATLRFGLEALREYGTAAIISPEAVERERGVVMAEKEARNDLNSRRSIENIEFLWPQSRYAERPVIGTDATLRSITRGQIVDYYRAWYRPERFAVLAVGDADEQLLARLVEEVFSPVQARGEARDDGIEMIPTKSSPPNVVIFHDRTMAGVGLAFQQPIRRLEESATREDRLRDLRRALAFDMFQRRLERVSAESGDALVAPTTTVARMVRGWETAMITANASVATWTSLAAKVEQEHRRAFQFGFSESELERSRRVTREQYETYIRMSPTRRSEALIGDMAGALLGGYVVSTPEVLRDDVWAAIDAITPDECLDAFRKAWGRESLRVFVTANPEFGGTRRDIAKALNESRQVVIASSELPQIAEFAYSDLGPAGTIVREQRLADLDLRLAELGNGVRLNHKQTDFEQDRVYVVARVGGGRLSAPKTKPGLDELARFGFIGGGLGRHRRFEIADALAGRTVSLNFQVDDDAFTFFLDARREHLGLGLKLLTAYLEDAAFRSEALRDAHASYTSMISDLMNRPGGEIQLVAPGQLFAPDPRFAVAPWIQYKDRTMEELRAWMEPELKRGGVELCVVGDVPWEEASRLVCESLGTLAPRKPRVSPAATQLPKLAPARPVPTRIPIAPAFRQVSIAWYLPVPEDVTIGVERRLLLLSSAIQERLWTRLREELGATYGPSVYFVRHSGLPAANYFIVSADVDAAQAGEAARILRRELERIRKEGVTDEEFQRVRAPYLRSRRDDLRQNSYWAYTVLRDAQENPARIEAARSREADTSAIQAADLRKLARKHIQPAKAFLYISEPGGIVRIFDGK